MTTLAQIEAGLQSLASVDFGSALTAFQTANIQGELKSVEDVANVVAIFIPQAKLVEEAVVVLGLIIQAYQSGLITSAPVESPQMENAARPGKSGGR